MLQGCTTFSLLDVQILIRPGLWISGPEFESWLHCYLGVLGQIILPLYKLSVRSFKIGKIILSKNQFMSLSFLSFLISKSCRLGTVLSAFHVETH